MNRHFGWAMLVAAGVLLGCVLGTRQKTNAEGPTPVETQEQDNQIADQLNEIKAQLKELNGMFRSGTAKVVVVINPSR